MRSNHRTSWIARLAPRVAHVRTADEALHWALDREGRLLAGHQDGVHLRVGLDAGVLVRPPAPDAVPRRATTAEADALLERTAGALRAARDAIAEGLAALELDDEADRPAAPGALLALLERGARRAARPDAERAAFAATYGPVRVLPPDCAQALVVQVTQGCRWGRCAFCSLYEGVPHRVRTARELDEHLDRVAALLGAGAALRARVFLGDANALDAPAELLVATLARVAARFPDAMRGGAHAFVDAFRNGRPGLADLRALRAAGLRRLTVGLESGSPALLRALNKPATPEAVAALVARARAAGLAVGVTVLAGPGGRAHAERHVADTARVVHALGLGQDDLVFVSPLVESEDPDEVAEQAARLSGALRGGAWRVVPYDIRRFIL